MEQAEESLGEPKMYIYSRLSRSSIDFFLPDSSLPMFKAC